MAFQALERIDVYRKTWRSLKEVVSSDQVARDQAWYIILTVLAESKNRAAVLRITMQNPNRRFVQGNSWTVLLLCMINLSPLNGPSRGNKSSVPSLYIS